MSLIELSAERQNPVDVVERLAAMHDWSFDRAGADEIALSVNCLLYTSPSPRDGLLSRMPSSA